MSDVKLSDVFGTLCAGPRPGGMSMIRGRPLAAALCGLFAVAACGGRGSSTPSNSPAAFKGTVKVALVDVFSGSFGFFGGYLQNSPQGGAGELRAKGSLVGY